MKYDTIIFDLDGTLLETLIDLHESVNEMLRREGYPERTMEEVRSFLGNGAKMLIWCSLPEYVDEAEVDRCLEVYRPIYKKNMYNNTRPFDGIMELLGKLRERGVKMAVVSNKPDTPVRELVHDIFGDIFAVALGDRPDMACKPARDPVDFVLKELNADIEHALFVGDSEVDVMTAKNAGLPCVGVAWGFRDVHELEEEGAAYIIHHPNELLPIVDGERD